MKKILPLAFAAVLAFGIHAAVAQSSSGDVGTPVGKALNPASAPPSIHGLAPSGGVGGTAAQILSTPQAPAAPLAPATQPVNMTAPAEAQAATVVADPCEAFKTSTDLYLGCQDRMNKIKRMEDARAARTAPPVSATPEKKVIENNVDNGIPKTETTDPAAIAAAAATAAIAAERDSKVYRKKGIMTNKDKKK